MWMQTNKCECRRKDELPSHCRWSDTVTDGPTVYKGWAAVSRTIDLTQYVNWPKMLRNNKAGLLDHLCILAGTARDKLHILLRLIDWLIDRLIFFCLIMATEASGKGECGLGQRDINQRLYSSLLWLGLYSWVWTNCCCPFWAWIISRCIRIEEQVIVFSENIYSWY